MRYAQNAPSGGSESKLEEMCACGYERFVLVLDAATSFRARFKSSEPIFPAALAATAAFARSRPAFSKPSATFLRAAFPLTGERSAAAAAPRSAPAKNFPDFPMFVLLLAQQLADLSADFIPARAAADLGHHMAHDLTHVLKAFRAGFGECRDHHVLELITRKLRRQVEG